MTPRLDPDILLLIAQHVKYQIPTKVNLLPSVGKAIKTEQSTLINLMKTTKVRTSHALVLAIEADC